MSENSVFIELYVSDVNASVDMFVEVFGAECVRKDEHFAFVRYGTSRVLLNGQPLSHYGSENPIHELPVGSPRGAGVEICVEVGDLDQVFESVEASYLLRVVSPPEDQSWGLRDFRAVHDDGFYFRVTTTPDEDV